MFTHCSSHCCISVAQHSSTSSLLSQFNIHFEVHYFMLVYCAASILSSRSLSSLFHEVEHSSHSLVGYFKYFVRSNWLQTLSLSQPMSCANISFVVCVCLLNIDCRCFRVAALLLRWAVVRCTRVDAAAPRNFAVQPSHGSLVMGKSKNFFHWVHGTQSCSFLLHRISSPSCMSTLSHWIILENWLGLKASIAGKFISQ